MLATVATGIARSSQLSSSCQGRHYGPSITVKITPAVPGHSPLAELGRTTCWVSSPRPSPSVDVSCFSLFCNELFVHFNSFWDKFCPEMFEQGMTERNVHPPCGIPEAELLDVIGTKVCMSCPPCYSQTPLITDFTSPSLDQKWFETGL
jgi:hypothetical protein